MAAKKGTQKVATKEAQKQNKVSIRASIDRLVNKESTSLKAIASVTIGNAFAVHGIRIVDSQKGLFVSMPSTSYEDRDGNTQYSDIFHPISSEARGELIQTVKDAYDNALAQKQDEPEEGEMEEEEPSMEQTM